MKMKYLGTAAAEGIPGLFCQCPVCEMARKNKGKDLRYRTSVAIDDTLILDFGPDINAAVNKFDVYLPAVKDIIITHSHADHCDMGELLYRDTKFFSILKEKFVLNLYGNANVEMELAHIYKGIGWSEFPDVKFTKAEAFMPFIVQGYTVTPLPANHKPDEEAFIYILEKHGRCLLYGNDTSDFPQQTIDYIEKSNKLFTTVSLDSTFGFSDHPNSHMGFDQIVRVRQWLLDIGCADSNTKFIAVHFSHNGMLKDGRPYMHEDLVELLAPKGFIVAFDGLEVEI